MQITVKLFGTLGQRFTNYQTDQGLELNLPAGSSVADLLALLEFSPLQGETVVLNGRFLSKEDILIDGSLIQIFQALHGG
jgi:sulfur carrier protein ThiS